MFAQKMFLVFLLLAAASGATEGFVPQSNSKARGTKAGAFPLKGTKPGVEAVTVLKIYRLPKWDMGVPNTPTYTPPQGSELIVVRFKRTALTKGQELALNQVALFEEDGQALEDAPRDIWAVSTGWTENIFVAKKSSRLGSLVINDVRFSLKGVAAR